MGTYDKAKKRYVRWTYEKPHWIASNLDADELGYLSLEKVGAHIHWVWHQSLGFGMSPGCLDEVRKKQKELFKDRKPRKIVEGE